MKKSRLILILIVFCLVVGQIRADPPGASPDCFLPDQLITLADGSYKEIQDVNIGDNVKVYNEKTHKVENAPVKEIQTIYHDNVHELHLSNGKVLKPTANHPFLAKNKGWVTISGLDELGMGAGLLEVGDTLYSLNSEGDLDEVCIERIIPVIGNYLTYNFIDMKHGAFLADDIVVHNSAMGSSPSPSPSRSLKFSLYKNNQWNSLGQDFHTHGLRSGEYRALPLKEFIDEDGYVTLKIEWTAKHAVDKVSIINSKPKPYKIETLKLISAKHSRDGEVKAQLNEKDFNYAHTVRGDIIDLEFEKGNLKPNNNQVVDYFFESYGFYHGLRTYLYPDVDTSDSYKEEINQYVQELNNYLESKNQCQIYQNPFIK